MLKKLWLRGVAKCLMVMALLVGSHLNAGAFTGSDLASGKKYYLFNIYQSKFLGADYKLQAPNIGTPVAFTASATGFTIAGTAYTATKNDAGYYQLKNGSYFYAFEDKVADPNNPDDENRAMYIGGGVTCQNTTNDTDRSYWQLISETEYAEWQAKKKFTVASLNVDGMPKSVSLAGQEIKLNPDATEGPGAEEIGRHLLASGFDVVGVSENFNYHSNIWNIAWNGGTGNHYNAMKHRGDITVGNANLLNYLSKKPLFDLDGLNVYYRIDGSTTVAQPSNESWTQWNSHNGYTDQGADGLIKKGYRYYLVTLADGTEIDLYTMHMDADDGQADREARSSQMKQLVSVIKATNNKRPIVIIGDSNTRYTRDTVKKDLIDALNEDERFTIRDPWIQFGRDGKYPVYPSGSIMASSEGYRQGEVVDKIWYINNKQSNIRIVAETYAQDLSFVASQDVAGTSLKQGSPLCDHKPCVVTFSYHNYDPAIDDQPANEVVEDVVYIRNRETGRFLKSGGSWGTHAVVGNYPIAITMTESNGKYTLSDAAGSFKVVDGNQPYVDGGGSDAMKWTKEEVDGKFIMLLDNNNNALTANDPFFFNNEPNYRWVITEAKNASSKLQQWEIVSEEQMREELKSANLQNPVNASWLMSNPNFDQNIPTEAWKQVTTGGRASFNLNDGKKDATDAANPIAQAWVSKDRNNNNTKWDIQQTVNNLPNGYYLVTCQAFQNKNDDINATEYIYIYANEQKTDVGSIFALKKETTNTIGTNKITIDGNSYYFPKNTTEASLYFNEGYYYQELKVHVTDGTLTIGIKHDDVTGSGKSLWCCFDNFQLFYLGTEQPANDYNYSELVERRTAELSDNDTKLTLTGIWRVLNESELINKVDGKTPLVIDATNATLIGMPTIPVTESTNTMIKVKDAESIANSKNVIANGKCAYFVLTDKKDFGPGMDFNATATHYTRTNTKGYNSVCMPFETRVGDYNGCKVYEFDHINDETITFKELDEDATIAAGTPVLVYSEGGEDWQFDLSDRGVVAETTGNTTKGEADGLNGSFLNHTIGADYYKLNSEGTAFSKTTSAGKIVPFRFYLKATGGNAVSAYKVALGDEDEETSIKEIVNSKETKIEQTYDINGRRVINITRPGIYVKGGKKVVVK